MFSLDSFPPWARIDSGAMCAANTRSDVDDLINHSSCSQVTFLVLYILGIVFVFISIVFLLLITVLHV